MFFKKHGDYVVSGFFMALSVVMYALAARLPKSKVMSVGPDFMPKVISIAVFILSAVLLVTTITERRVRAAEIAAAKDAEKKDYKRVILSFLMVLIYVYTLKLVGFTITSLVFLPAEMFILAPDDKRTKKDLLRYVIISVIFTLIVYFLFRYGFKILLPRGIFAIEI